jgi:DNA polymerase elongation subunit (family B)
VHAFLDIETGSRTAWLAEQAIIAGAKPQDAPVYCEAHAADGALSPTTGQIVCWAVAVDNDQLDVFSAVGTDESELLTQLSAVLNDLRPDHIVAHNGHGFDFPFIRARALALRMPRLAKGMWQSKPWEDRLIDTADPTWTPRPHRPVKGWEYSLDALAELFGIQRPTTLPGSAVPLAWYRGELEPIREHCIDDVVTLRALFPRLAEGRAA